MKDNPVGLPNRTGLLSLKAIPSFRMGRRGMQRKPMNSISFLFLLLAIVATVVNIFLFKNRKLQMKLCSTSILLCVLWMIGVAVICYLNEPDGFKFYPSFFLALPVIAVILLFMARARIKHDEKLVRAADRIR